VEIEALAQLLHETAEHHDPYERSAPPHNWWDWYAAYMSARQQETHPRRHPPRPGDTWHRSSMLFDQSRNGTSIFVRDRYGG
jgi:hypothetical protein